jgi:hypothetical protein
MFSLIIFLILQVSRAETSYVLENYLSYQNNDIADSSLNPNNQIFDLASQNLGADIRGELKWKNNLTQIIIRPRYTAEKQEAVIAGEAAEKNESNWDLTDAFGEAYLSESFSVTGGLQVYQWGPAELMNPSDPLFHFNTHQKSFAYKEKGKVLIRANYSFNRDSSLVVILEPVSNNDAEWREDESFTPKALVKYEIQNSDGSGNIGVVGGREEKENAFAGLYFTDPVGSGFSVYADAKAYEKEINFKPEQNGLFFFLVDPSEKKRWPSLSVTGIRWEGRVDIRLEFLYNSAGFSDDEMKAAFAAVSNPFNPNYVQNLRRFQRPGLELLGKRYSYGSFRVNEPFDYKDLNFYFRHLYSWQDFSSQGQMEFDKSMADSLVLFGSVAAAFGKKDSEFKLLNDWQTLIGVKWVL